jgi:hypothetical protein
MERQVNEEQQRVIIPQRKGGQRWKKVQIGSQPVEGTRRSPGKYWSRGFGHGLPTLGGGLKPMCIFELKPLCAPQQNSLLACGRKQTFSHL